MHLNEDKIFQGKRICPNSPLNFKWQTANNETILCLIVVWRCGNVGRKSQSLESLIEMQFKMLQMSI